MIILFSVVMALFSESWSCGQIHKMGQVVKTQQNVIWNCRLGPLGYCAVIVLCETRLKL